MAVTRESSATAGEAVDTVVDGDVDGAADRVDSGAAPRWAVALRLGARWQAVVRLARYAAGSVVAVVASEIAFLLAYGPGGLGPTAASVIAWAAGAVPNYVLNRRWAWQRRGRARLGREILPYAVIAITTAALATLTTNAADGVVRGHTHGVVADLLEGGVYLATYGVMFVLKYLLFDRYVFSDRKPRRPAPGHG